MIRSFFRLLALIAILLPVLACGRQTKSENESRSVLTNALTAANVELALEWLRTQQNADGSYGARPASLATPLQSTAEAVRARLAFSEGSTPAVQAAIGYLNAQLDGSTEALARRVVVAADAGGTADDALRALLLNRNDDGGFGEQPGYTSNVLDSAFALEALDAAQRASSVEVAGAVAFLRSRQRSSGGFADGDEAPSVDASAAALRALWPHRLTHEGAALAVASGQRFLLSARGENGLWGEDFSSAAALLALVPAVADVSVLEASDLALRAHQQADGSWAEDSYTTALVLRFARAHEARRAGSVLATGAIAGYIVLANSAEPIVNAVVSVDGGAGGTTLTNGDGYFLFSGVTAGVHTVTASKAGYSSASTSATALAKQTTITENLVLDVLRENGFVRGSVFAVETQQPLPAVEVVLGGASPRSVLTDATGEFDFGPVSPGTYSLSFRKTGYLTLSGSAVVVGGQTLVSQLGLTKAGGFVDTAPGEVRGRVVDGKSGSPVVGAAIALSSGPSGVTGNDGVFVIPAVPRGDHQGAVRATGYQDLDFTIAFSPGAVGDVGTIKLFPSVAASPPSALLLRGRVIDGVSSVPIANATVALSALGLTATTSADGRFELANINLHDFSLAVSAAGYPAATFGIQAAAFGEAYVELKLSPAGSGATASTLVGRISDAATGEPIAGAQVSVLGTPLTTLTGSDGDYSLAGIERLAFTTEVVAVGYARTAASVELTTHGIFTLNRSLEPLPPAGFQVLSVAAQRAEWPGNTLAKFDARVVNLLNEPQTALLVGEIRDQSGVTMAMVSPYAEGTTTPTSSFAFSPNETKSLVLAWPTAQVPAGTYELVLRVVEPGSINRATPFGRVLAENAGRSAVVETPAIDGALAVSPPLTQAGSQTPVTFTAVVRNAGNAPLEAAAYVLTVSHPDTGNQLLSLEAMGPALAIGAQGQVAFGSWQPTTAADLRVRMQPKTATVAGVLNARLYVGDKASGSFVVDRAVVPEGTQTVRGRIDMQGVDVTRGTSSDPLFALVKDSVRRGGEFTAPAARTWHTTNRCLGCHIQSQSLLGLSSALRKADVDEVATKFLFNAVASSQWADGALRISNPEFTRTQTTLGLWSLDGWSDATTAFRTKYNAARLLLSWRSRSGTTTRWSPDYPAGWWNTDQSHTALTVKSFADLIKQASRLDLTTIPDYKVSARFPADTTVADVSAGPDGTLYVLYRNGSLTRIQVSSGAVTRLASGLGDTYGLAVTGDGTAVVTRNGSPQVITVFPDGRQETLSIAGSSLLTDVVVAPDGSLYFADLNANAIRRRSPEGVVEVFLSAGLLNRPNALAFDASGGLLIANRDGYNVLRVGADKVVSAFADGLAYRPLRLGALAAGGAFVATENGLLRLHPDGAAVSAVPDAAISAVAEVNGSVFVSKSSPVGIAALEIGSLAGAMPSILTLKEEVPFAARYLLSGIGDNNSDNSIHAFRLVGLAEARTVVDDPALRSTIDAAIASEDAWLRSAQLADGGWGRYRSYPSDPLTTAMVGSALEYREPSPSDPQIRKTIQYLLNTQRPDGSWDNVSNGLSTRLASTSFVMIFMPQALERLGGIDVDLQLDLATYVQFSNPTLLPTNTQPTSDGSSYLWKLTGVTGAGRSVQFDLTLLQMALGEQRKAARDAFLTFNNSFSNEKLRLPLEIPTVHTIADLDLLVTTDKSSYLPAERTLFSATIENLGPLVAGGEVRLAVRSPGGAFTVAELTPAPFEDLAAGGERVLTFEWNTGVTLAGSYEVYGRLSDASGRLLVERSAPFQIAAPAVVATTAVTTDKPVYDEFDDVNITGRVRNAAPNAILPDTRVELEVKNPLGEVILSELRNLNELGPNHVVDLPFVKALAEAASGEYSVVLTLKDQFTRAVLSTSEASFEVRSTTAQGVSGTVAVDAAQVEIGAPNRCLESAQNLGNKNISGLKLIHRFVNVTTSSVLEDRLETVDLAAGQEHPFVHPIDTAQLTPGDYACVLLTEMGGATRTLAFADFRVVEPAVRLSAAVSLGSRGRVLFLLDGGGANCGPEDPYGPPGAPLLATQRSFLNSRLKAEGISYTITDSADAFTREFYSGSYLSYGVLAESEKLSELGQQELREASFRGEGLVVAGDHDSRNNKLHDALGVKYAGTEKANMVTPRTAGSPVPAAFALLARDQPMWIQRRTAESLAVYGASSSAALCDHDAITYNAYGYGRAVFSGPDLLALATRDGANSVTAATLRNLLRLVEPPEIQPRPGAAVPVRITVNNLGVTVPLTVSVPIPAGAVVADPTFGQVSGQTLTFAFSLASGEAKTVEFWLRLPIQAQSLTIQATVSATRGSQTVSVAASSVIVSKGPTGLAAIATKLDALAKEDRRNATALRQASDAVARANGNVSQDQAIRFVIKATDQLLGITDVSVMDLRAQLDFWLRWARASVW